MEITWDAPGERTFETGVSNGVLYLEDGRGVPWNGLTAVDESAPDATTQYHLDGIKYLDAPTIDDFEAKVSAFTYPDEFLEYDGVISLENGITLEGQPNKLFGLSWRTRVGNDLLGVDFGYKLHLAYHLTAQIDTKSYVTKSANSDLLPLSWVVKGLPETLSGYRPTAHVIFDSTRTNRFFMQSVEAVLYGSELSDPRLPSLEELRTFALEWELFTVVDNGDGTWSLTGPDELIEMLGPDLFQVSEINATYLDESTYTITTSES